MNEMIYPTIEWKTEFQSKIRCHSPSLPIFVKEIAVFTVHCSLMLPPYQRHVIAPLATIFRSLALLFLFCSSECLLEVF